ncbi:MAG: hypothetical protein ACE5LL_02495 [Alphaproteobacteria bacterium]
MNHRSSIMLTLALVLLTGTALEPAWAQSARPLAGSWINDGGAACGGDNAFEVDVDDTSFRMTRAGRGPGIAELQGTVRGDRLQGKAIIDWTLFENGPVVESPFTGPLGDGGQTLTVTFVYVFPIGTTGLKPTGWGRLRVQCTYAWAE